MILAQSLPVFNEIYLSFLVFLLDFVFFFYLKFLCLQVLLIHLLFLVFVYVTGDFATAFQSHRIMMIKMFSSFSFLLSSLSTWLESFYSYFFCFLKSFANNRSEMYEWQKKRLTEWMIDWLIDWLMELRNELT